MRAPATVSGGRRAARGLAFPAVALAAAVMLWSGCTAPPSIRKVEAPNACVIDSIRYKDALAVKEAFGETRWAEVVAVVWDARPSKPRLGHAVCFFEYAGSTLVYDPGYGTSVLIRGRIEKNPRTLAEHWIMKERIIGRFPWDGPILSVTPLAGTPSAAVETLTNA
ncbi:hypothetical protein OpiT1DRAFT_01758 [Opitutaceae bacterium TAV1]|nr:hypothetical protein OpiT1DRAFT_01758 [Opitutaceae bacterium TAV1]